MNAALKRYLNEIPMNRKFEAGNNLAMKVPLHEYEATLMFYREILGLEELTPAEENATPRFDFGGKVLWIDAAEGCSQAEIWLEVTSDDPAGAAEHLRQAGLVRCDAIEALPDGFDGYWIVSPCNIIHLVSGTGES